MYIPICFLKMVRINICRKFAIYMEGYYKNYRFSAHKNHVDDRCKELYNSDKLKEKYSTFNTMSCEQTFAWLSRYKKILCSIPKVHHHFYLHRMVKHRNSYITYCYKNGKRPIHSIKETSKLFSEWNILINCDTYVKFLGIWVYE